MGNKKRVKYDDDDDDYDDDDMPDMSRRPQQPPPPPQPGPSSGAPQLGVGPPPNGGPRDRLPPPGAPLEPWQPILQELLHKFMRAERSNNFSCPFTRQGLARLFQLDSHLYHRLRAVSRFDLPPDPTSPHTLEGGRSFCTTHHLRIQSLQQHCGCQAGGKTCIIQPNPPATLDDWSKYAVEQQLHYCLLKVAKGMDVLAELAPPQYRAPEQPQRFDAEICWPPALRVTGRDLPESEARIRQKFGREVNCTFTGYPEYHGPIVHAVLLVFSSAADDHLIAFDNAKVLEESLGHDGSTTAVFVTRPDYEMWRREKEKSLARGFKSYWYAHSLCPTSFLHVPYPGQYQRGLTPSSPPFHTMAIRTHECARCHTSSQG